MVISKWGLLRAVDGARVQQAIAAAERRTTGEIRVTVSRFFWGNVRRVAERAFERLGMTRTRQRNAILFFVVPSRRRFAVLGDEGIHAKVGQEFWDAIATAVSARFREGDFTGGLVQGIESAGGQLAEHFPWDPSDVNELPDVVDRKGGGHA